MPPIMPVMACQWQMLRMNTCILMDSFNILVDTFFPAGRGFSLAACAMQPRNPILAARQQLEWKELTLSEDGSITGLTGGAGF